MTIADKLTLLANTKEALRAKLKISKSVPFSKYPDYVDWVSAPSIPNKAFYADFTNDRYVKDGMPCNFKDLFTFSRAGKAWLVKETGLQEYATDVPRLDNGLLIEQSATNYFTYNFDLAALGSSINKNQNLVTRDYDANFLGGTYVDVLTRVSGVFVNRSAFSTDVVSSGFSKSMWLAGVTADASTSVLDYSSRSTTTVIGDTWQRYSSTFNEAIGGDTFYLAEFRVGNATTLKTWGYQVEESKTPTSLIVANATPVTRPADYLLNNITGTTVTGDWDSTLTLSIVNGQLVHSGYGRIRSLEIN